MEDITQLVLNIGKQADLATGGLAVTVKIIDAKTAYGNERYEVRPVAGSGSVWVDSKRLTFQS